MAKQVAPEGWFPNHADEFPSYMALRFIPYSVKWLEVSSELVRLWKYGLRDSPTVEMLLKNQASIYIIS
ncbi:MAG: hypothetical protein AB7F25_02585 [Deferribacterales bacterium]